MQPQQSKYTKPPKPRDSSSKLPQMRGSSSSLLRQATQTRGLQRQATSSQLNTSIFSAKSKGRQSEQESTKAVSEFGFRSQKSMAPERQERDQPSQKQAPGVIDRTEAKYPSQRCSYCLAIRVFLVPIGCGHSYCSKCCLELVKITQIKQCPDEKAILCPKCLEVNHISDD